MDKMFRWYFEKRYGKITKKLKPPIGYNTMYQDVSVCYKIVYFVRLLVFRVESFIYDKMDLMSKK